MQQTFERLLADIKSFNFRWLVPIDTATSPQMLMNPAIWVMLLLGFFPLTMLHMNLTENIPLFLLLFTAYYCFWWSGYYFWFVCQRSVNFWWGVAAMAFTAFLGVPALLMAQKFPPVTALYSFTEASDVFSRLIGFTLGVGVCEELTKALPVLVLAFALKKIEKPIDGIFFGAMSGLGFAVAEGVMYISKTQGAIVMVLIRTTTLPFLHSLWSATVGYFIALALINRRRGLALILLGLAVCAVHHGVYDTLSSNILGLVVAAFLYLLFAAYMARAQTMVRELQDAERQAAEQNRLQWMFHDTMGRWRQAQGMPPLPVAAGTPPPPAPPAAPSWGWGAPPSGGYLAPPAPSGAPQANPWAPQQQGAASPMGAPAPPPWPSPSQGQGVAGAPPPPPWPPQKGPGA